MCTEYDIYHISKNKTFLCIIKVKKTVAMFFNEAYYWHYAFINHVKSA
jgi:hypothetical protein